jgi:small-conductance mechanosensitive channel
VCTRVPVIADFWADNSDWISAAVSLGLALLVVFVLDRAFQRRRDRLSRDTQTRLRFVRRLLYAGILLVGAALALSQFEGVNRIAASVLASGVVAAAVIGFAARQTLANVIAGIMLTVTQPLRVGDWVTFDEHYGVVEDLRLNYTVLRTPSGQRVVIPNELLASGVLTNDTLADEAVGLDVALWLPPGADADRAVRALAEETGGPVSVAEVTAEGIRLSVGGDRVPPHERGPREAELRARCLRRLRAEGLLEGSEAAERS